MTWPRFDPSMPQSQVGYYSYIGSFGMSETLQDICYHWTFYYSKSTQTLIMEKVKYMNTV